MLRMCLVAGVLALASLLSAASGRSSTGAECGDTVTTDVVLTHSLHCDGDGLIVDAAGGNVTVDLAGYTIAGAGTSIGIRFVDEAGGTATVENGTIRTFAVGIDATSFYDSLDFESLYLLSNDSAGIWCFGGNRVTIANSTIANNLHNGAAFGGCQAYVTGSTFRWNGLNGVRSAQDSLRLLDSSVLAHNGADGASIEDSVSTITGNTFRNNDGTGLAITESVCRNIPVYNVSNNIANSNSDGGISVGGGFPGACIGWMPSGSGNAAKNNVPYQCSGVVCSRDPS